MSNKNIQNEQELWDQLSEPVVTKAKTPAPRRIDGFFLGCMAGVAAVSVAATLVIGGMVGGGETPPVKNPAASNPPVVTEDSQRLAALEEENAALRNQVELQRDQLKSLQAELLDLYAAAGEMPTLSTEPGADNELANEQLRAYEIFEQIRTAYADFDRETLEELIPQMDEIIRGGYLSRDALEEYYRILEYVEMPSNG